MAKGKKKFVEDTDALCLCVQHVGSHDDFVQEGAKAGDHPSHSTTF